jgi:hypothetical protein
MSALLDDIINLAIDGKNPLANILRKTLLLGHELKNDQLKAWANQELNGYKSGRDVPEYRILSAHARGNFIGPFYAQYNGHIIPPAALEKNHKEFAEKVYLIQSVSALEESVSGDPKENTTMVFHWPANLVVYYQEKLMQNGFICHSAWQEIPTNALVGVLDTVRNRTLNMALQLKDELGTSYTDLRKIESRETQANIQNIIIQNTGGNTNVAFGQSTLDASGQSQTVIAVGDRKALDAVLTRAGLGESELDALTEALAHDGAKPGSKVTNWIKENAGRVLSGGVQVGSKIGQEILTAWIKAHCGL